MHSFILRSELTGSRLEGWAGRVQSCEGYPVALSADGSLGAIDFHEGFHAARDLFVDGFF